MQRSGFSANPYLNPVAISFSLCLVDLTFHFPFQYQVEGIVGIHWSDMKKRAGLCWDAMGVKGSWDRRVGWCRG